MASPKRSSTSFLLSPLPYLHLNWCQAYAFSSTAKIIDHFLFFLSHQFSLVLFSSVAQSCPTLRPHESQHARPPCSSPTPGVYSNSSSLSRWCHPAISPSVTLFSFCPQSLLCHNLYLIYQQIFLVLLLESNYVLSISILDSCPSYYHVPIKLFNIIPKYLFTSVFFPC